ncbi:hypothetical protein E1B28_008842 [Marasmius oreades]|uniref:RRM domain-containing protein n=1 Tax=Marasmius oreades TaxID=181124 RepID=A0A9P7UTP4_9AGAR|nr:uncharacterized protein E1B28_008842 [Marasmius oreades]KAG7092491.1 hypothetical protein E1B28_008842 [Marasmius oreades]
MKILHLLVRNHPRFSHCIHRLGVPGDVIEVQLPSAATNPSQQADAKHRGFAFVTYGSSADAQDAIDNMDLNELKGRVIKVNLARPMKTPMQLGGNRAVWESEEWLKQYAKPLSQSGGVQGRKAASQGGQEAAEASENAEPMDEE